MNTTTNARKTANGLTLPETFPLVNQRGTLRNLLAQDQNDAIVDLVWHMENILKTSYSSEYDNAAALDRWSHAEADFADAMGKTWEAVVGEFEDADNGPDFEDGYDADCQGDGIEFDKAEANHEDRTQNRTNKENEKVRFPGLPAHSEIELTNYVAAHPFRMVQGNSYANAFKGACSSRRAGLQWVIWAKRMQAAGLNPSLIAYIVLKVYGMDARELIAYKNR